MKKFNWLFPSLFAIALTGSAFTRQSANPNTKKDTFISVYYENRNGYCVNTIIDDMFDNCVTNYLNYVCSENIYTDGTGWTGMYQCGFGTVCFLPYYSYYPNH